MDLDFQKILDAAERAYERFKNRSDNPREKELCNGGYLSITDAQSQNTLCVLQVGELSPTQKTRFAHLCLEKPRRLLANNVKTSNSDRDPESDRFAGALLLNDGKLVFAFSGLPDYGDECVAAFVAIECNFSNPLEVLEINKVYNPFIEDFLINAFSFDALA